MPSALPTAAQPSMIPKRIETLVPKVRSRATSPYRKRAAQALQRTAAARQEYPTQREGTGLRCLFERQTRLAVLFSLGGIGIDGISISAFLIWSGWNLMSEHRKGQNAY